MSIITLLLILVCVLNFAVGALILMRNPRKIMNLAFFGIAVAVGLWVIGIAGFLAVHDKVAALAWAKAYYIAPLVIVACSSLFADHFPSGGKTPRLQAIFLAAGLLVIGIPLLVFPHFLTQSVVYHSWGKQVVLGRFAYFAYSIYLLVCFYFAISVIHKKARTGGGLYRSQAVLFLNGYVVSVALGVFFNLILPWFGNYRLISIGPLATTVYVVATAYSVIKHKMFDIRFVVVRAAAYIFSIILLSLLYIVPSILLVAFIMHIHFTWPRFAAGVGVALIFALFYGRLRDSFNAFTTKLFWRSYYEPQDILDKLSDILVRTIDVDYLQKKSRDVLFQAIRTNHFTYWLEGADEVIDAQLTKLFHGSKDANVLVLDELDAKPELIQELHDRDVAVVVRLRTTHGNLGFITLGFKESGEMYNERDKRLLSIAADEIAISLQNALHFEEIQHFNRTLQQRVEGATKELRRSNDKLKALDETKDDFISMASHQWRTPLTSVKGYLSLVLEGDAGNISDQQRKLLTQAFISSQRMVYLISDLLNVSRLRTGKFVIEQSSVNLADIITDEIAQLVETARSRSIELKYTKPKEFPTLMLDETKTRQVVMNFIDNAIYYTPSGGHIEVQLVDKPTAIELKVVDDGIGVPKPEQHHLFTKFYRAQNARRARPDGTGLGLFMAKKVITAQGGALLFESQEGKGSTFGFTFSKSKHAVKPTNAPTTPETAIAK